MTKTQYQMLLDQMVQVNQRLTQVDQKVDRRLDDVGQRLGQMDRRFDQVDGRLDRMDQRFVQMDQRFDQVDQRFVQIDQRFVQMDQRFGQMDQRLDGIEETTDSSYAEWRRHFDIVAEGLEHKISLVAEGLMGVQERQRQSTADLEQVRVELRSEIRLVYTALDRRLSALEGANRP